MAAAPSSNDLPLVVVPIVQTTTDAQGQTTLQTTSILSQVTAVVTVTVVRTDAQGSKITALEIRPAVLSTITDAQGRPTVATSAARFAPTPGEVLTQTDARGSTFETTYTPSGGRISSVKLITTTGADGKPMTITSYTFVEPADAAPSRARLSSPASSQTSSPTSSATTINTSSQSPSSTSPGIIAGATLVGVALLIVLAFMVWYFGFHRRKKAKTATIEGQDQEGRHATVHGQQAEAEQVHEADSKQQIVEVDSQQVFEAEEHRENAAFAQDPPGTWAHQNVHEIGELATRRHASLRR